MDQKEFWKHIIFLGIRNIFDQHFFDQTVFMAKYFSKENSFYSIFLDQNKCGPLFHFAFKSLLKILYLDVSQVQLNRNIHSSSLWKWKSPFNPTYIKMFFIKGRFQKKKLVEFSTDKGRSHPPRSSPQFVNGDTRGTLQHRPGVPVYTELPSSQHLQTDRQTYYSIME